MFATARQQLLRTTNITTRNALAPLTARRTIASSTINMPPPPTKESILDAAHEGQAVTADDVSAISREESAMTGQPPMKGGPAATARSIHHKQQNFVNKAAEISTKPTEFVTQEDARELQAAEARARGGILPPKGSLAAETQSMADQNMQRQTQGDISDPYVTKDDARVAQSMEAREFGGENLRGGVASTMQSAADKLENSRRGGL